MMKNKDLYAGLEIVILIGLWWTTSYYYNLNIKLWYQEHQSIEQALVLLFSIFSSNCMALLLCQFWQLSSTGRRKKSDAVIASSVGGMLDWMKELRRQISSSSSSVIGTIKEELHLIMMKVQLQQRLVNFITILLGTIGNSMSILLYRTASIAAVQLLRCTSPVFSLVISYIIHKGNMIISPWSIVSLFITVFGVILAIWKEQSLTCFSTCVALSINALLALRNISSKYVIASSSTSSSSATGGIEEERHDKNDVMMIKAKGARGKKQENDDEEEEKEEERTMTKEIRRNDTSLAIMLLASSNGLGAVLIGLILGAIILPLELLTHQMTTTAMLLLFHLLTGKVALYSFLYNLASQLVLVRVGVVSHAMSELGKRFVILIPIVLFGSIHTGSHHHQQQHHYQLQVGVFLAAVGGVSYLLSRLPSSSSPAAAPPSSHTLFRSTKSSSSSSTKSLILSALAVVLLILITSNLYLHSSISSYYQNQQNDDVTTKPSHAGIINEQSSSSSSSTTFSSSSNKATYKSRLVSDPAAVTAISARFENLLNFFKSIKDQQVYFFPNPGNAGDTMIHTGFFILAQFANLKYTKWDRDYVVPFPVDVCLYGGGGNFVKHYTNTQDFIKAYQEKCKLLVILPQTVNGHEELLRSLPSHVHIWAREKVSYDYLLSIVPPRVAVRNIYLSHDLAFALEGSNMVRELKEKKEENGEMVDGKEEEADERARSAAAEGQETRRKKRKTLVALRSDVEQHSKRNNIAIPSCNEDVSSTCIGATKKTSFKDMVEAATLFLTHIHTKHDAIITDRLHVGIAGSLLGMPVKLLAGSYYKVQAIYEHSIRDFYPQTVFLKDDFSILDQDHHHLIEGCDEDTNTSLHFFPSSANECMATWKKMEKEKKGKGKKVVDR